MNKDILVPWNKDLVKQFGNFGKIVKKTQMPLKSTIWSK